MSWNPNLLISDLIVCLPYRLVWVCTCTVFSHMNHSRQTRLSVAHLLPLCESHIRFTGRIADHVPPLGLHYNSDKNCSSGSFCQAGLRGWVDECLQRSSEEAGQVNRQCQPDRQRAVMAWSMYYT